MDDQMFEAVIDRLIRTKGDVINSQLKTRLSYEILDHSKHLSRLFYEEICCRTSDAADDPEIAIFAWWVCHLVAVSKFGAENIQEELDMAQG